MIEYIGEHAWAGQLGHTLAIISLVGAILGTLGYYLGTVRNADEWIRLGRIGFRLHSVAVLGVVVTLFTMLFNHWFEYDYVWKHSNVQMPMKYIASSSTSSGRMWSKTLVPGSDATSSPRKPPSNTLLPFTSFRLTHQVKFSSNF